MLLNAQSHEAVKLTLSATSIIFTARVKASTLLSLPKEPAVDVQMPLPAVLPTGLPDLWDIKVVSSRGERTQRPRHEAPEPKTYHPATVDTAAACKCDHYCRERKAFGKHSLCSRKIYPWVYHIQ